jgi:hypothetical protein
VILQSVLRYQLRHVIQSVPDRSRVFFKYYGLQIHIRWIGVRQRLLGFSIIALLLLSPIVSLAYAEDGENSTIQVPPEILTDSTSAEGANVTDPVIVGELLAQAREARLVLMAAFSAAYGENYTDAKGVNFTSPEGLLGALTPSTALDNQMHGDDAIGKALQLLEQADANAAAQQIQRAMKHYRKALRKAYRDNPEAMSAVEESGDATEPDLPPTEEPAADETEIQETKLMLMQQFSENFQERVMSMEENVNSLMNQLSDEDARKAGDALEKAERKLLRIQERLDRGEIDEAMDDLENATDGIDDALDGFEDDQTAQMLRTIDKLEAKVRRTVDKTERKAAKGQDTSGDEDEIDEARGQLNKFKDDLQRGKSGSAPGHTEDNGQGSGEGNGNDKGGGKPEKEDKSDKGGKG